MDKSISVTFTKQLVLSLTATEMCVIIVLFCISFLNLTNYGLNGVSGMEGQGKYGTAQHN